MNFSEPTLSLLPMSINIISSSRLFRIKCSTRRIHTQHKRSPHVPEKKFLKKARERKIYRLKEMKGRRKDNRPLRHEAEPASFSSIEMNYDL